MTVSFGYCVEAPIAWPDLLALAREIDANSRFDSFWMPDAITSHGAAKLDAFAVLAAVASVTKRVRLGTLVAGNAFRHPAMLAQTVATLDHISGGRITLGMGAGWPGEHRRYGIEFWDRRERIERLDEAVQVMKLLWTTDKPTFVGKYYQLDEPPYRIESLKRPHPPIAIGGGSDRMLRIAARHAEIVSPMVPVTEAKAKVDAFCRELGRDPAAMRWVGGGSLFLHDDRAVVEQAMRWAVETCGESEQGQIERDGLFGPIEAVTESVRRQIANGCEEIIVFQLPRVHVKSLMRFSEDVIPAFR